MLIHVHLRRAQRKYEALHLTVGQRARPQADLQVKYISVQQIHDSCEDCDVDAQMKRCRL